MRYAVISDIHANLTALKAVLKDIEKRLVDEIICVGDIVGYGARPVECTKLVKTRCRKCVAGNHDWAVLGKTDFSNFNKNARDAISWTIEKLDISEKKYLSELTLKEDFGEFVVVHSTPDRPEKWNYLKHKDQTPLIFSSFKHRICFIGHTHVPMIWIEDSTRRKPEFGKKISLQNENRYIINVGSVGQPRDKDPRACFVVYDDSHRNVVFHRVEYDVEKASQNILNEGLPENFASRLHVGK